MLTFNYNQAIGLVNELNSIANDINSLKNRLAGITSDLRSGWQGNPAQQFFNKCNDLQNLLQKETNNIKNVATSLRNTAVTIDNAEKEAIRLLTANL